MSRGPGTRSVQDAAAWNHESTSFTAFSANFSWCWKDAAVARIGIQTEHSIGQTPCEVGRIAARRHTVLVNCWRPAPAARCQPDRTFREPPSMRVALS